MLPLINQSIIIFVLFPFSIWQPGITTDEIDEAVHNMIIENGAYPSPLGYGGFPKSVCTSVNECICHGIPDSRPLEVCVFTRLKKHFFLLVSNPECVYMLSLLLLQDGDIINIDVTVYLNVSFSSLVK